MTTRVPGLEQVRFVSSGTEALMSAVRLARGFTGRDKIVKFDGCYHGHSDALLVAGGSGVAQLGLPGSAGVTARRRRRHASSPRTTKCRRSTIDVAAVLVEPVAANMNLVAPAAGFLGGAARASATASARCSSSTRSSPAFAWPRAAPRSSSASRRTSGASARSSAGDCRSAPLVDHDGFCRRSRRSVRSTKRARFRATH